MRAVTGWDRIDEQDDKGNDMGWLDESYLPFILDSGCFCYPKVWKMLDNNLQELLLNEEKLAKLTPLQLAMVLNAIARWLVFFKSYLDDGAGPPNSEGGGGCRHWHTSPNMRVVEQVATTLREGGSFHQFWRSQWPMVNCLDHLDPFGGLHTWFKR